MIRWLEGTVAHSGGTRATFAADTPLGRVTVKPIGRTRASGIAWRGRLPDGAEIERSTAQDCRAQVEAMIHLQLERKARHAEAENRDRDPEPGREDQTALE